MKQISLWTTAIVSALFVVMVCLDNRNWKLLGLYAAIMAAWCLIGWFWIHRKDLEHDLNVLRRSESPMNCRWIGTAVFFILVVLVIIVLLSCTLWWISSAT